MTVIDGGLATELEARGHDLSDRLWSARLLLTDPGAIEDVHLDYFRAGATVARRPATRPRCPASRRPGSTGRPRSAPSATASRSPGEPATGTGRRPVGWTP